MFLLSPTEPEPGSNPSAIETQAERASGHAGDEYVLNGAKTWITNSPIADVAIVWAKDRSDDDTVRGFLVDTENAGVTTNKIGDKLSLRSFLEDSAEPKVPLTRRTAKP